MTSKRRRATIETLVDEVAFSPDDSEPMRQLPRNGALQLGLLEASQHHELWEPPVLRQLRTAHDPKRAWRRRAQVKTWPQLRLKPWGRRN